MTAPLYVEVFPLLVPKLTGVGRFAARLLQKLSAWVPLCLTTFVDRRTARVHHMRMSEGQQIAVDVGALCDEGDDLNAWTDRLFRLPRRPFDASVARRHTGLYLWRRPDERRFRRELGVFYDFTPLIVPWSHTPLLCASFQRTVEAARFCDKVLAISHSTRADAAWLSPVPQDDVVVAYPGPSQCLTRHAHAGAVARRKNVGLIVGTREPRKNGDFLIEWFLKSQRLDDDFELWWAGPRGWLWDAPNVERGNPRLQRVRFLGMVSDARLCELYQQATFTVYPSLYEGFGFPVLDSLLHGAPVLCSYNSSLVELESPGVFYFDPRDTATLDAAFGELASAGQIAIDDADLRRRFCWDTLARTVLWLAA
ncbi:MAG TPA: glycosyltransferase [Pirellulales bacterium]|nr:glycosyltransferase [Pirellulales bacterium]